MLIRRSFVATLVTLLLGFSVESVAAHAPLAFACDPEHRTAVNATIPVRISNQATLPASTVDAIVAIAGAVWARYGIRLEPALPQAGAVGIIFAPTLAPQSPHVNAITLASTLFENGEATSTMYVWVGSAEALIASTPGHPNFTLLPKDGQNAWLSHMLGVALAHEFGHFLLNTASHSSTGLLRANIPTMEFLTPNLRALQLTMDQQDTLCRGLQHLPVSTAASHPGADESNGRASSRGVGEKHPHTVRWSTANIRNWMVLRARG